MKIEDNWPFDQIKPSSDEAIYDILVALEAQLDRVDVQADELHDQRFLQTATTRELEKLAGEVGVKRQTGENDDRLRFRALIGKAVTRSDGTLDDVGAVLYAIFGDDTTDIKVSAAADEPVLRLEMPSKLIDDIPLTANELEAELANITAVGDGFDIITDETFRFGESGSQGIGKGELT